MAMGKKIILGLLAEVTLTGPFEHQEKTLARIDTGATKSSLDVELAKKLHLQPSAAFKVIKSASGIKRRPVVSVKVKLQGEILQEEFTLAERSHMTYPVLIGQNILKKGNFLINPKKKIPLLPRDKEEREEKQTPDAP